MTLALYRRRAFGKKVCTSTVLRRAFDTGDPEVISRPLVQRFTTPLHSGAQRLHRPLYLAFAGLFVTTRESCSRAPL
jgi:hypothetical protein